MIKRVKKISYCKAWIENTNARCTNKAKWGTSYCGVHYPKKKILATLLSWLLSGIGGIVLGLFFQDPLIQIMSKCPILYGVDKEMPVIEKIFPDIDKPLIVGKKTNQLEVFCFDKDSGLNLSMSFLKISYKDNQEYKPVFGKLDRGKSKLAFNFDKELRSGEYLLEIILFDKAKNKNERRLPFVVRSGDELTVSISYDAYENASEADRNIFNAYIENKKDLLNNLKLYCYKLSIHNMDDIAILKNIFLSIDISGGGMFFCWEQIGNLHAKKADISGSLAGSFDKRYKERVYGSQSFLNIDEIGPHGFVNFVMLVAKDGLPLEHKARIWEGIEIYGTYLSEGYGSSESCKVHLRVPQEDFKSSR